MRTSINTTGEHGRTGEVIDLRHRFRSRSVPDPRPVPGACPARSYAKDEEIFGEDEPADYFYEVLSGAVRTYKALSDGRRQIDEFHLVGDLFGVEPGRSHRFTAEAINDAVVRPIRRSSDGSHGGDRDAAKRLAEATAQALSRAQDHMLLLGRKCAKEKVASFLLKIAGRLARDGSLELPMSRTDIADHLGLTIETVSRTLTQLDREGAIRLPVARRLVTLRDQGALRRLDAGTAEERFGSSLPRTALRRHPALPPAGRLSVI